MIGIICAMEEEINGIYKALEGKTENHVYSIKFMNGKIGMKQCTVALSSVGKVNAAVCAQTMIMTYNPSLIINIGTAGGLREELDIGDIVIAKDVIQHDYDISAFGGRKKGEISGIDLVKIPCDQEIVKICLQASQKFSNKIYVGDVVTGDKFVKSRQKIVDLINEFNGIACDMESAAIGQVCYMAGVKFAAIKIISDKSDKEAPANFDNFVNSSSKIISEIVKEIVFKIF